MFVGQGTWRGRVVQLQPDTNAQSGQFAVGKNFHEVSFRNQPIEDEYVAVA
jgi:hypothetical protein